MKKVAILQSSYIPWKGYFDIIRNVDEFVLLDDVQFTRRDWRNRNRIKTRNGPLWLTIPVQVKNKYHQLIKDTRINGNSWANQHLTSIEHHLGKCMHFKTCRPVLSSLYEEAMEHELLSSVNYLFIKRICELLSISTPLRWSSEFELHPEKSRKLLNICKDLSADVYVSGPAAKDYLDCKIFEDEGVSVEWFDYSGFPEYEQLHPPFEHAVSIIDLLANTGDSAQEFLSRSAGAIAK